MRAICRLWPRPANCIFVQISGAIRCKAILRLGKLCVSTHQGDAPASHCHGLFSAHIGAWV